MVTIQVFNLVIKTSLLTYYSIIGILIGIGLIGLGFFIGWLYHKVGYTPAIIDYIFYPGMSFDEIQELKNKRKKV